MMPYSEIVLTSYCDATISEGRALRPICRCVVQLHAFWFNCMNMFSSYHTLLVGVTFAVCTYARRVGPLLGVVLLR